MLLLGLTHLHFPNTELTTPFFSIPQLINKVKAKTWLKTDASTRQHLKSRLLQNMESLAEPNDNVRNGFARVVAAIGRIEIPQNTWPELLPWIWTQAGATNSAQKEVSQPLTHF